MHAVTLVGAGQTVIWIAAVATAITVLVRLRPVRWLGRTAVRDPIVTTFRREVREVVAEVVRGAVEEALARHRLLTAGASTPSRRSPTPRAPT